MPVAALEISVKMCEKVAHNLTFRMEHLYEIIYIKSKWLRLIYCVSNFSAFFYKFKIERLKNQLTIAEYKNPFLNFQQKILFV